MKSSYTNSLAHTTYECKYHIVFAQGNLIILQKYYKKTKIYDKLITGDKNGYKRKF